MNPFRTKKERGEQQEKHLSKSDNNTMVVYLPTPANNIGGKQLSIVEIYTEAICSALENTTIQNHLSKSDKEIKVVFLPNNDNNRKSHVKKE